MDTQVAATAAAAVAGKVCRLCFAGGGTDDLQLSSVQGTKALLKRIYECTSVQITSGEGGIDQNAQLCQPCVDRIDDFYAYRALCRTNNDHIRQLVQGEPEQVVTVKQEKHLDLDDEGEDSSRHHPLTTAANEIAAKSTPKTKDVRKQSSFLQSNQFLHTDEITIKREALPEEDADVYYNSEGETEATAAVQSEPQLNSSKKANYRIIIAANNRERLVYEGYLYCRHFTRRDGSTHWRCRLNKCQAAVNLMLDETIVTANNNVHCHAQNAPEELMADISGEAEGLEAMAMAQFREEDEQDGIVDSEMIQVEEGSLVYTMNKKQGETLLHLGFRYCKRYQKMDGSTFWKCRSNSNKCSAGVYVYPEARVKYHGQHNHDKVVEEGGEQESFMMEGGYTICEDVEDEEEEQEEGDRDYSDDIAALLSSSLEVMMPEEKKQTKQQYGVEDYEITTNVKGRECLIFEGHQYSKDRERVDGAVYWRCRRNYDKCRALAIVMPDGTIEKCGDHLHDTDKRHLERQEQGSGSRFYRIIKNQRGNDAFVFEGHRFSKEWSRVDGSIIWRCSYRSGVCRVKVVLNADGYVYKMGTDHEHDHETTEPPVTEEVALDEDVEFVEESPMRRKLIPAAPSASNVPTEVQAAGGYRITRNRKGYEALIHDGYRYCKIRVRQDGSVKWLCKMNKKTCRAAVELFPDGSLVKSSEYNHNHERPIDEVEDEEDVDGLAQEVTYPIDPEVFGNSQWYYIKNSKNGMSMIHANYRYTKKCDRVDGTSLWRCSAAQRGCKAGVILFPNDTLAMVENAEHSHKPYDSVPRTMDNTDSTLETAPPSPDVIEINENDDGGVDVDSEMNMHSLLQTVLGADEEDGSGWMANESTAAENESVWFNSSTDRPYPRPDGPATFRIIKNRRNTDSLVHRGYRYCKIRDRVDGSILWACQMNKKTCKASVNLTTDGRVEVLNGMHNHVKTDVDDMGGEEDGEVQQVDAYYPENGVEVDPVIEEPAPPATPPELRVPAPKHPDYFYSVNKSNRECLIHRGYRFGRPAERPDGTTTWRCSMGGSTCMAVVTIQADGTPQENDFKHNHQPLAELPPEVEKMVVVKAPTPPPPPEVDVKQEAVTPHKRQGDSLEWNGFHYRKIKELPDGSVIWICQIDSCRVAVKMLPHGQLKMLSESEHNHTASGPLVNSSSSTVVRPSAAATEGGRNRSYRLFKNQRGQMTLLYDGYRYSIRNRNQDGSSSWKCRANSSCRVIIFLMPDDRIVVGNNNAEHNHEPNWESTRKLEAVAPTRVNPLYDYLNIIPGGSSTQVVKPPAPEKRPASAIPAHMRTTPTPDASNYGRNVIEYKGYYFRLVVRKKNGREYWRCVHFKNRACRAALFCRDTGAIVMSSNGKEHSHGGGAAAKPVPSATPIRTPPSEPVQPRIVVQPSPPDEVQLTEADEERYIDHGEYVIAKNRKDQNTLIFKDRRYYLSYNRSDGSAVWRCAHRKRYKCYAYVRLRPDGRLLSTGEQDHSHSSTTEEPTVVEGHQQQQKPPQQEPLETRNYRIVKNRVGNDILIHDSHRFRLNYQRNDGTTHWRCIWARSNHCSAGVYLYPNGLLKNAANEAAIIHNHPPPSAVKKAAAAAAAKVNNPVTPAPAQTDSKDDVVVVVTSTSNDATPKNHPAHRTIPETDGITDYRFVEEGNNKILVCRGYRYWYTWIRKDGSIYYRCTEVKKRQCPFGILLLANGRVVRSNDTCHNHDGAAEEVEEEFLGFPAETSQVEVSQPKPEEEPLVQYPPLEIPEGGDTDFKVIKTSRGESLIYKGYRYWAKNRLTNGTVSLCCTRKKMKKCPAMLRLLTDGRVMDPVGMGHTHAPNIEGGGVMTPILPELPPAITVTPIPRPPSTAPIRVKVPVPIPVTQLAPLSFNEESDDECDEGDEVINGSKRYSFMKSSAQRNFIVFQGYVYDFEHKQHDGCVFYRCKTSEVCPASLMLLTNGRVMAMDDALHQHEKPDLGGMRQVGRGSKEFKIVQNKNGSNILVHRGHRYTTPRAKTDGAGIWYCHTYIPNVNRRCYVPIELLPNGRVAPVGDKQHDHKPPYKAKPDNADSDSAIDGGHGNGVPEQPQKVGNRMLLLAGHRYNLAHRQEDGAVLWKCARKGCTASMYRLTDGTIVKGPEHNHEKMESISVKSTSSTVKRKHSEIDRAAVRHSDPTRANPYIGQSIINEGFRYIFYLTRRDGTEHWRCCRRIPLKCRGALVKQPDGTLVKSNDEGHNHPPDHNDQPDYIPNPIVPSDQPIDLDDDPVQEEDGAPDQVATPTPPEDEGSYDYELIDVKGKKRGLYLIHKGAMFVGGHTRRDRARYYRCRTVGCKTAMLLLRNGLLVRSNEHPHDCQNAVKVGGESDEPDSKKVCVKEEAQPEEESSQDVVVQLPDEEPATNGSESLDPDDVMVEVKEEDSIEAV